MSTEKVTKVTPNDEDLSIETIHTDEMTPNEKKNSKVTWYLGPAFLLFWLVIIFAVVIPIFFSLPDGLTIENEASNAGQFIAERAENLLLEFDKIGPKVAGSYANENITVQFLLDQLENIRSDMLDDLFEMEVDVQVVSGAYIHWTMVNTYQGVQNVVVRFSTKGYTNDSYLLINSHFDSKPGSPGSGDDGAMVVIMLETLRVLATTRQTLANPIILLFNGAEENPLQASHGFITQHEWAKNCKAFINLDSAGSGNRELLFQSGPNNPWLMSTYSTTVKRSFATTFAEELFQSGIIPSDTDFRNFRDYGNIPGLDFAHSYNGYVYHTKFDRSSVIPIGTLQTTGDNILAMARAFANSSVLKNTALYADGHAVFYDFLGYYVVCYTEDIAKYINKGVSAAALVLVFISLWHIASKSFVSLGKIVRLFFVILLLQLVSIALGAALPLVMALIYDSADSSMTYFTNKWLVLGLYVCPSLLGLAAPSLLYLSISRNDKVSVPYRLQMFGYAHAVVLSIVCLVLTYVGIRSSYFAMISLIFYCITLLINLGSTLYRRAYYWSIFVILGQVIPFIYFTYLFHALLSSMIPMMGRFGTTINPDLVIALVCVLAVVLSMGFLIQLLNIFNHTKVGFIILPTVTLIFAMISLTNIGFPYRPATNVERVNFIEVHRVFYEHDGSVSRNESGYYFDFQDRRKHLPFASYVDLDGLYYISQDCDEYMMCGLPIYNHRLMKTAKYAAWLPREEPLQLPGKPNLQFLQKTINDEEETVRLEFELEGPAHMSIFMQPHDGVEIAGWSFLEDYLETSAPYHIFFAYGVDNTPLQFYIDLKRGDDKSFDDALLQLGISGHYIEQDYERDEETKAFLKTFPSYSYIMEWPASYERFIF